MKAKILDLQQVLKAATEMRKVLERINVNDIEDVSGLEFNFEEWDQAIGFEGDTEDDTASQCGRGLDVSGQCYHNCFWTDLEGNRQSACGEWTG